MNTKKINLLIITKLFPTEFLKNYGIFNKVFIDYFQDIYNDVNIDIIRPIPFLKNFIFNKNKLFFHPEEIKNKYKIYFPKILTFGKYLLKYHHIDYFNKIKKLIKKEKLEFDIIHSHWIYPDSYVAVKIGKLLNKPVIIHCHGSDVNRLLNDNRIREKNKYTLFNCKKIFVVSKDLKNKILKTYPELTDKIKVIYNGIDLEEYKKLSYSDSLEKTGLTKDSKIKRIVFIGNLIKEKGIIETIKALDIIRKKRNDFILYLIGKQFKETIDIFNNLINELDLNKHIIFTGEINHNLIKHWFNIAHISILPSYSEGFGLVVLESLASHTKVIASNVGGIPEIINNKFKGILIEPKDHISLANAILQFLNNKNNKFKYDKEFRKFDLKIISKDVYNEYLSVLKKDKKNRIK